MPADPILLHASCVAFAGRGVLILGPSGSGKSGLALGLIALGAGLVADDAVLIAPEGEGVRAARPPGLPHLIEARGVGLLRDRGPASARVALAVDLGRDEVERLPPRRSIALAGIDVDVIWNTRSAHFPAAIRHYVMHGRHDP